MLALADQIASYRELYNWVRPHEMLGFVAPMVRYLAEPLDEPDEAVVASHLSAPESVQTS